MSLFIAIKAGVSSHEPGVKLCLFFRHLTRMIGIGRDLSNVAGTVQKRE